MKIPLIVASVWFIIVGGWLIRPGRPPICIVCGNHALDLGIKVITLAVAVIALVAALRIPSQKVAGVQR